MSYRILAAAIMIALAACRPTGTYEVATQATPQVTVTTEQSIATSVIDRRPYVLNGDEDDDFLGTERANWGGAKNMKTESGRPFADVLTYAIAIAPTVAIGRSSSGLGRSESRRCWVRSGARPR